MDIVACVHLCFTLMQNSYPDAERAFRLEVKVDDAQHITQLPSNIILSFSFFKQF